LNRLSLPPAALSFLLFLLPFCWCYRVSLHFIAFQGPLPAPPHLLRPPVGQQAVWPGQREHRAVGLLPAVRAELLAHIRTHQVVGLQRLAQS